MRRGHSSCASSSSNVDARRRDASWASALVTRPTALRHGLTSSSRRSLLDRQVSRSLHSYRPPRSPPVAAPLRRYRTHHALNNTAWSCATLLRRAHVPIRFAKCKDICYRVPMAQGTPSKRPASTRDLPRNIPASAIPQTAGARPPPTRGTPNLHTFRPLHL